MNQLQNLGFVGRGHLVEITQQQAMVVHIRLTGKLEEVTLQCTVDNLALLTILDPLYQARMKQHTVELSFKAAYQEFGFYYTRRAEEDPQHMLGLHCQLQAVTAWYRDGVWMPFDTESLRCLALLRRNAAFSDRGKV